MGPNSEQVDHRNLRSVNQFVAETPWLTAGKMRWLLFHRDTNGLAGSVYRIGGRIYIDIERFQTWLSDQRLAG